MARKSRYFRHVIPSHQDPKLEMVIEKFKMEGFGFWWMLVELYGAAHLLDDSLSEFQSISMKKITKSTLVRSDKAKKMLLFFSEVGLISLGSCNLDSLLLQLSISNYPKYFGSYKKTDDRLRQSKVKQIKTNKKKANAGKLDDLPTGFFSLKPCAEAPQNFIEEFGQDIIDKNWDDAFLYYDEHSMKKSFGKFMYESLDRTRKKFGSKKTDHDKFLELMTEIEEA